MHSTSLVFAITTALVAGQRSPASTVEFAYGDARGHDITAWVLDTKTEVRKRWALPYEARRRVGHSAIALTVDRSGRVMDTKVELASDVPGFDDSAVVAIRAARLLALPDDYPEGRFTLTLVFWFNEPPFDVFKGARAILDATLPPAATVEESLEEIPAPAETETGPEPTTPIPAGTPRSTGRIFFNDGTSLEIESFETRGDVVILHRRDGRLQSVPGSLVDWGKTLGPQ